MQRAYHCASRRRKARQFEDASITLQEVPHFLKVLLGEHDSMNMVMVSCMQVLKLRAICSHCHREAAFTHRLGDEKDVEVLPDAIQASAHNCVLASTS